MQRRDKRRLRTFLIYRAPSHHNFAQAGFIHQRGVEWRRRPLGGIGLLHVVHKIKSDGARRAGIEGGKDARLPVGRNFCNPAESSVAQHTHSEVAAFAHAPLLSRNRRLANPMLQALHGFVVTLFDFFLDEVEVATAWIGVVSQSILCEGECGCAGGGALEEGSSVHGVGG